MSWIIESSFTDWIFLLPNYNGVNWHVPSIFLRSKINNYIRILISNLSTLWLALYVLLLDHLVLIYEDTSLNLFCISDNNCLFLPFLKYRTLTIHKLFRYFRVFTSDFVSFSSSSFCFLCPVFAKLKNVL